MHIIDLKYSICFPWKPHINGSIKPFTHECDKTRILFVKGQALVLIWLVILYNDDTWGTSRGEQTRTCWQS